MTHEKTRDSLLSTLVAVKLYETVELFYLIYEK